MADDLITDLRLIRKYSRQNEEQNYRFRTHLKVGLDLSNAELDAVVHETTDAVWAQIDCLTCGNCCKRLQVVVDDADIQRLSKRLGMTLKEFSTKHVAIDEERVKLFNASPCPFLGPDNRCAVYEDRPQSCRDYPFLYEPEFRQRTFTMVDNTEVCPIVFNVWDRLKRRFRRRRR